MGNHRFKLSELIPNALFYKLRDMGKSKKQHKNSTVSPSPVKKHHAATTTARSPRPPPTRSSYYSRLPKTSMSSRLPSHPPTVDSKSSASSAVCCRSNPLLDFSTATTGTGSFSPEFRSDQVLIPDESLESSCHSPCSCVSSKLSKASATTFKSPPGLDLRPIITKQAKTAGGVRLRLRSPRISTRKSVSSGARGSRAVLKASLNPRRDFKKSMEKMITENNIRASKDLEELLACYLYLNSEEYHNVIINVFKQIWLDLNLPPQYPK